MSTEKMILTNAGTDKAAQAVAFKQNFEAEKNTVTATDLVKDYNGTKLSNYQASILGQLKGTVKEVEALRRGTDKDACIDFSFGQYLNEKFGFALDKKDGFASLLNFLNIPTKGTTIAKLSTMPNFQEEFQWLIPEIVRDAIRTGFLANPIWDTITSSDTNVSGDKITIPQIKMPDVPLYRLNEAEANVIGTMSFDEKTVRIFTVGTGFSITDKVRRNVSIDVLAESLGSVGIAVTQLLNTMAVMTLLNGDGNSNPAPVIGTEAITGFDYDNDILRMVIKMATLGYTADHIIANEGPARNIMSIAELKGYAGDTKLGGASIKGIGVPTQFNILPSGVMPVANQILWLDRMKALQKYTSSALMVESERLILTREERSVVSLTTGFAKYMDDASVVMDKSILFSGNGFPASMNGLAYQVRDIINE